MKNKILPFCIFLCIIVTPLCAAPLVTPGQNPSFTTLNGIIPLEGFSDSQVDFELNLAGMGIFDSFLTSDKFDEGNKPPIINLVQIDKRIPDTDFFSLSNPIYLYLRFFGNRSNAPTAEIIIDGPLKSANAKNSIDVKATLEYESIDPSKQVTYVLDSVTNTTQELSPVFEGDPKNLEKVIDCYKLQIETIDEYWKAAPESYSTEIWLRITSTV